MRFGHFDDARREYVIDTPRTPLPLDQLSGQRGLFSVWCPTPAAVTAFTGMPGCGG